MNIFLNLNYIFIENNFIYISKIICRYSGSVYYLVDYVTIYIIGFSNGRLDIGIYYNIVINFCIKEGLCLLKAPGLPSFSLRS